MTPSPSSHDTRPELDYPTAARFASKKAVVDATVDPVPVSRKKTVSPGTLLLAIVVGSSITLTLGNWLQSQMVAFNDVIVKFFLALIPVLALVLVYFAVRFVAFWRDSRAAEIEALAQAEEEAMQREARFAAGRIKGDRRLCIRPRHRGAAKTKRRRADRLQAA